MNIIKGCVFYVLAFLWTVNLYAQSKPATPFKLFFEKTYVHTDRDVYAQGDTIWFKAYLVNGQTNAPINTSGNVYIELIRTDSAKVINRETICMINGAGNGDFSLPDSIPPGYYTLRAYTNWMRNFGDNFVFEKRLNVVGIDAGNKKDNTTMPAKAKSKMQIQPQQAIRISNEPVLSFYPEGGSLVEGLNSKIAVKAQDASGIGFAMHGAVLNTSGDTVAHFSCDTLGMGMLSLLSLSGQKYRAVYTCKKNSYTTTLPQALLSGFALRITSNDSLINASISASDTSQHQLILIGRHAGKTFFNQPFNLANAQAMLRIPKKLFPEGIAAITLYDEQNKPHCERLVYIQAASSTSLSITTDKPAYQPKSKISVKLKLKDVAVAANLSMAVVDESVVPVQQGNIASYLLLQSELKGSITHPERYFDTSNVNRFKQLDLLLLTQGWRDFLWRRIADSAIRINYAAEPFITLSGKVRQKFANKPIKNMNVSLTAFKARGNKLFSTRTDSLGRYYFDNVQLYGQQAVTLVSTDDKGNKAGWILLDSLSNEPMAIRQPATNVDTSTHGILLSIVKAIVEREKTKHFHSLKDTFHLKEVVIKQPRTIVVRDGSATTFGYPEQLFTITKADEYFESLDNWMAHNVKGAFLNGVENGIIFHGYKNEIKPIAVEPTFFANGKEMPLNVDDPPEMQRDIRNIYYNLSMDKVKKVLVRHMIGTITSSQYLPYTQDIYLVYLTVTDDAFDKVQFGKVTASVSGYYNARTFYKPIYEGAKSADKLDYRTTIHWEPNIITDKNGEAAITFYNASPKTNVRIVVQGISNTGQPITGTASYMVK